MFERAAESSDFHTEVLGQHCRHQPVQMDQSRWAKNMENLSLSNDHQDDELDFDSPPKQNTKPNANTQQAPKTPANRSQKTKAKTQDTTKISDSDNDSRDDALRAELESVRRMNQVIEGVTASLEKARSNMDVCFQLLSPTPVTTMETTKETS